MTTVLARLPVVECVFARRLNRFVAEAVIQGRVERLHVTNTGRLHDHLVPGRECLAARIRGRKLSYRLVAVRDGPAYAVIDTRTQSRAFEEAVERGLLCFLRGCRIAGREPRHGGGRLDYELECPGGRVLVETKSAVLRGPRGEAMYPDCPTDRGLRHILGVMELNARGTPAALVFIAAMPGARCFKPYREGDERVYEALSRALARGTPIYSFSIYMTPGGEVVLDKPCLPPCPEWAQEAERLNPGDPRSPGWGRDEW